MALIDLSYDIIEQNGKFVGIIESPKGIVACTIPYESKEQVEKGLSKTTQKLRINKLSELFKKRSKFSDILFNLDKNPLNYWNDSLKIPLDYHLFTPKQEKVAKTLRQIPPGKVVSYGELAKKSGIPKGARFIGNCMAGNYIPLIIPCHRVIKSGGKLGNYSGGGSKRKIDYLVKEKSSINIR